MPRAPALSKLVLLLVAILIGGAGVELALGALGLPRFHAPHSKPTQFQHLLIDGEPLHVSVYAANIRFVYDSDPRGYFGPGNAVVHTTNASGFRGRDYGLRKRPGTTRLLFLGDSFTFGEGVRDEDTYAEVSARQLAAADRDGTRSFEALNLGVGAYNTEQAAQLLRLIGMKLSPDAVVLGFTLNDAEPKLYEQDPTTGEVIRRERGVHENLGDPRPPDALPYQLRTARLVWQLFDQRRRSRETVAYYRALYAPEASGWRAARRALVEIGERCRGAQIRCALLLFPVLHELSAGYPFQAVHAQVAEAAAAAGLPVIDLLESLRGTEASSLWVHPTDQHPNETVHAIAGRAVARWWLDPPMLSAGRGVLR